jgi:hypothetical protein
MVTFAEKLLDRHELYDRTLALELNTVEKTKWLNSGSQYKNSKA